MTIAPRYDMVRWALPIRRNLPLLISALLITIVVGFGWLAHRRVHAVTEKAAGDRLGAAADRLSGMLGESAAQMTREVRSVAGHADVVAAARARTPAARARAERALAGTQGRTTQRGGRTLFARDCAVLASAGGPGAAECAAGIAPSVHAVGPFRARGDSIGYLQTAPVVGAAGDTLGYVVATRTLGGSGAAAIESLMGAGTSLLVGNADGSLWTDLVRRVPGPLADAVHASPAPRVEADGIEQLSVSRPIPNTPWVLMVRMPQSLVLAPARRLMGEMALGGAACLLLGILGALGISRRVTRPISEITDAAAQMAAGDYSQRVPVRRADELGQLAAMFNSMASQVETASNDLIAQAVELEEQVQQAIDARRDTSTARSLLDDVLASSPVGIAVLDPQLRYVKANPAIAALNGRPPGSYHGNTPAQVDPAMGAVLEPVLTEVRTTGAMVTNRRVSAESGGVTRHWLVTAFPVRDGHDQLSSLGLVILDTTSHELLEAKLLQAQKMEAIGRLAGGVAHDFNNLLTVILSYSAMALDTLRNDDSLRGDMEEIRDAAARAAGLTRQLLAFSRNQVMQPRVISLNDTAREMDNMLRRLIGEDVTLELRLADDLWEVRADPGQMEQVIMNLVVNARDAMPDGGRVEVATQNGPDGEVLLTLTDSGMGMSTQTKEHLFEPFFTTKPAGKGTGLGLSTVYGIVTQSGGTVRVDSEVGGGTTFTIRLPGVRPQAITAASPTPAFGTRLGTGTILLVEDDPALRTLAARVLRKVGYTVLEAGSSEAAQQLVRSSDAEVHLLLTDVVMPGQNGRALAEILQAGRPELRVMFMSGYTDDEVVRRGVVAQSNGFLQKPFTPAQLIKRVQEAMEQEAA